MGIYSHCYDISQSNIEEYLNKEKKIVGRQIGSKWFYSFYKSGDLFVQIILFKRPLKNDRSKDIFETTLEKRKIFLCTYQNFQNNQCSHKNILMKI